MEGIQTFKGSWPWPWIRPYGTPSCITHRPLPVYQISLKSKKVFVDGRTDVQTDGHFPPLILLGRHLEVEALRETQTLCAGCSKAEPKNFAPPQTPFTGAQDGQNLVSWRWSLLASTDPVWWRSIHAILNYHGNKPTNKQTHRQDQLQYIAPQTTSDQCDQCKYESAPNSIKQYCKLHKCKV